MQNRSNNSLKAHQTVFSRANSRLGLAVLLVAAMLATGCLLSCSGGGGSSSGSGSGTVSALTLPDRISVTSVEDSNNSQASLFMRALRNHRAFDDDGTDYDNQQKDIWVEDTEALSMVNDILGVVQDTAYENFVNAGPYKALVKKVGDSQQSEGGSNTTSTTTEELMEITVNVTRASNTSPMIVKVWVVEEDGPGGVGMLIRGHFTVTEGVSTTYPYGKLEAHFKGVQLDANGEETDTEVMTIAIKVGADSDGNVIVQAVDQGEEDMDTEYFEWENSFRLVTDAALSEGKAYVSMYEYGEFGGGPPEEEDYQGYIAYNADYFKEKASDAAEATVYDKNSLHYKVYRYKLFEKDSGDKVVMDSGFPITLENGKFGYIGYYGLWVNDGVQIENGDTVTNMDGEEYTVFTVGGKLRKHTKDTLTMADLDGVELSKWECAGEDCADIIIAWNAASESFKQLGARNMETGQIVYLDTPQPYVFASEYDGAWCEPLNAYLGLGRLYLDGMPDPTNETEFAYHAEETIDPSNAADWTFYYWGPVVGQTQQAYWASNPEDPYQLTFDAANLVLKYQGTAQVDTDSQNNFWMSPLTTTEYAGEEAFDAYNADIYYSWSTGPNQWDQFTTLKDADDEFVSFDPPLHFSYQHSTANDLNGDDSYTGKKFSLDYDGFELHIPWNYDPDMDEWQPIFSLKDGTQLTDDNGDHYVVKGIEAGVVMREAADPDAAADLVIDETIEPPTLQYDASKTDLVGDKPDATLKVIKGELI